nr:uncharacterized protein CI109_007265 [Kwoniella shandongensis]KAA5524389.1 hypothetical protein CI109_007265 [Kwoniella shandongensis]
MASRTTRSQAVRFTRKRPSDVKVEPIESNRASSSSPTLQSIKHSPSSPKRSRLKHESESPIKQEHSKTSLRDKKAKLHAETLANEPFPSFSRPSSDECHLAHSILSSLHGKRTRPTEVVASKDRAGCGDSPSVLDALVRTILSQNTSDANSTRAKLSMDKVYGGSDEWEAIAGGGREKLQEAIKCGGLSAVKSKVILNILDQVKSKYGSYSLDHLHKAETDDAMQELLAFDGVGPKTASCVLLFCLGREDFAVDTHVYRITGLLGWRPKTANREQTYHHLNKRIPAEDKYGLHILLVSHGKLCDECKAGGKNTGKCELRKAFRENAVDVGPRDAKEQVKQEVKGE